MPLWPGATSEPALCHHCPSPARRASPKGRRLTRCPRCRWPRQRMLMHIKPQQQRGDSSSSHSCHRSHRRVGRCRRTTATAAAMGGFIPRHSVSQAARAATAHIHRISRPHARPPSDRRNHTNSAIARSPWPSRGWNHAEATFIERPSGCWRISAKRQIERPVQPPQPQANRKRTSWTPLR